MLNPNDDLDQHVIDNAVILMSLLVTRFVLRKSPTLPARIRKRLLLRLDDLITRYKNPSTGIEYNDCV